MTKEVIERIDSPVCSRADPTAVAHAGSIEFRVQPIARRQHGLITRRQLASLDVSRSSIQRRLRSGLWHTRARGVIDVGSHRGTWEQGLMVALLAVPPPGGAASHRTAGWLHGLLDLPQPSRYEVLVPRGALTNAEHAHYRTTRRLTAEDVTAVAGFPVTSLARTLADLRQVLDSPELELVIWDAVRRTPGLTTALAGQAQRMPTGARVLLDVLAGLHPELVRAESPLEATGLLHFRQLGLPWPRLQLRLRDAQGRIVKRVDAAWPEAMIVVEFDGRAYHQTPRQHEHDRRQRERLQQLGWEVVVVRAADLHGVRRQELGARLHALLAQRKGVGRRG